jgi:hypothetical protein
MKLILAIPALLASSAALAQTYPTAPDIVATKQVGWTVHWTWVAPTQNVDNSAITGALTYDSYASYGGAFTKLASGLTASPYAQANLLLGTECIYVVAVEAGSNTIPSPPSNIACVKVTTAPVQSVQPKAPVAGGY